MPGNPGSRSEEENKKGEAGKTGQTFVSPKNSFSPSGPKLFTQSISLEEGTQQQELVNQTEHETAQYKQTFIQPLIAKS